MEHADERPSEPPIPQPAEKSIHLEAHVSDDGHVNQAGRDMHLHYKHGIHGARRVEPGTGAQECPYPGLASFGLEQARWFFGREQLTAKLTERLDSRLNAGGVQMVLAPSGAGKSSLLHAGLLSQLDTDALPRSSRWPRMVFTPTADPLAALAAQVAALTGVDPATLVQEPDTYVQQAEALLQVLRNFMSGKGPAARLVAVVDQFEELFTLCTDDQQQHTFIELLSQLASPRPDSETQQPIGLVVVGVRADFYSTCANYSHLRTALEDNQLVVGPMSGTELREAILYPAQNMGLDVEPGLVELLLRDLGDTATTADERGMSAG